MWYTSGKGPIPSNEAPGAPNRPAHICLLATLAPPETLVPDNPDLALRFAVALGLGMLIGLERERSKAGRDIAGLRTFMLTSLTGAMAMARSISPRSAP